MSFKWIEVNDGIGKQCTLFKCKDIVCIAKWYESGLSIWYYWSSNENSNESTIGREWCSINKKETQKEYAEYIAKYYNPRTKMFVNHFYAGTDDNKKRWIPVSNALLNESMVQTQYELYLSKQELFIKKLERVLQKKPTYFQLKHIIFDYVEECIINIIYSWLEEIVNDIDNMNNSPLKPDKNDCEWIIKNIGEKYGHADYTNTNIQNRGTKKCR